MNIYEYRKQVLDKLRGMSTEEFYKILRVAGVDCELKKGEDNMPIIFGSLDEGVEKELLDKELLELYTSFIVSRTESLGGKYSHEDVNLKYRDKLSLDIETLKEELLLRMEGEKD